MEIKTQTIKSTICFVMLAVFLPLLSIAQNLHVVTVSKLNVRKSPSAESAVIGSLSKGDVVNVRELKKSWAKIDFKNSVGYVAAKHLQPIQEGQSLETKPKTKLTLDTIIQDPKTPKLERSRSNDGKRFAFFDHLHFRLTSTLSLGLSDLYSFDAYSHPRFGFGVDAGTQITTDYLPEHLFSELTLGYMSLGNSNYSFPSFSINILPIGYRSNSFDLWKFQNIRYYAVGGMSVQFSGGGIFFYRNSQYYYYSSKPTVNLYVKGGIELTDMIAVGFLYMHGLNNVCYNLPIGIKHSAFQIYGSFLFDKWNKR